MKTCISRNSSSAVGGNEDLLTEILLRLPAKPLLRFKSVSKQWLSLISDPDFRLRHTRRTSLSGVFLRRTTSLFDFVSLHGAILSAPFLPLDFSAGVKILQSCNGLFLCSTFHQIGTTRRYFVYNPSTHRFSELPPPDRGGSVAVFGVNLAFDPLRSNHYEVVLVRSTAAWVYSYQIEIYSSKTRNWSPCGDPFSAPFDVVFDNGVFWNGAIHWLSPSGASLYFDISRGSLGRLPKLPIAGNWSQRRFRYFGESRGHLHLVEVYAPGAAEFDVFELDKDYSKWIVKYHIDLGALIAEFPEMVREHLHPSDSNYYAFIILLLAREDVDSMLLHIPGKVISYNLKDGVFKKLCDINSKSKTCLQFGWFDAYPYLESLACV